MGYQIGGSSTDLIMLFMNEHAFLGFDLRRVHKRKGNGSYIQMTPKKKAPKAIKTKVRDIIQRNGATPMRQVVKQINASLAGWVNYFRVGNANHAFGDSARPLAGQQ